MNMKITKFDFKFRKKTKISNSIRKILDPNFLINFITKKNFDHNLKNRLTKTIYSIELIRSEI